MTWDTVKEARRKLSGERGTIRKDWGGRLPVALIYPNSYRVGMSSLGFQTIYGLFNSYPGVVCERVFWDEGSLPPISLESQRPLDDFPVLAFSISFELDYLRAVLILRATGIPLFAAERGEGDALIIGGGPCLTANPEPLASLFDAFVIGEGEPVLPTLVEVLTQGVGERRGDLLKALAQAPGVYVPVLHRSSNGNGQRPQVTRQWARSLDFATTSVVLTPEAELGDMYLMEAARGCGWGCRFCLAGYLFRPPRYRLVEALIEQAEKGRQRAGRLGLVGAAVSDHPQIDELAEWLRGHGVSLSVSSLRVKPLSPVLLRALAEGGGRGVALAPETGSERLRRQVNKEISNDDVLRGVGAVAGAGLSHLKLYFMVGLPSETDEDVADMVQLTLACRERLYQPGGQLKVNVSPFVPKAGTPFQGQPMAPVSTLKKRLGYLKKELAPRGVPVAGEGVEWSLVQGVLARGDAWVGEALARIEEVTLAGWRRAVAEAQLEEDRYLYGSWPHKEGLPWFVMDSGVGGRYLDQEASRAQQGVPTPPCPVTKECHRCGVC